MNYLEFKRRLKMFSVFSITDIYKIEAGFDSRRLVEWQTKGYIKKIINRWYYFSDIIINEEFLYLTANNIYSPSYLSFETALSYYQLIPEAVYTITSACSLKTNEFKTQLSNFSYRHLKPSLLFGYSLQGTANHKVKMAEPEKALLDYLYLNKKINTDHSFEGLRINKDLILSLMNMRKLNSYLKLYNNKTMELRVTNFLKYIQHA